MFIKKKVESLRYALRGLGIAWQEEHNFRFEIIWAVLVLLLALFLRLPQIELIVIIFMIGFVLTTEALNTALEELCNKFEPSHDPHVAKIKDLAAAAVLLSSITACTVGLIIFIPHLTSLVW
jgi:diacylglycerol kinase